ncbi:NAD(P)-dependent oxidoreductase [Pollutimonas bauzanensis]|jgi:3-hydroxyisobutyrate dehydrogenase|uniref:NAD(P)-dependent oxidoreductase n=1 Tax=Pollutimonas bauzanensis TaxID=658167 RepID=UPI003340A70B
MRIGFIGLGQMGFPMFGNLSKQHANTIGFDGSPELNTKLRQTTSQHGLNIASSLLDLQDADVIITMLPHGKAVRACLFEGDNTLALVTRLAKKAIIIDMSSSSPLDTIELASDLKNRGMSLIDAPVSGSVPKAAAGTLSIMAGGDDELIESVMPLLEAMGKTIIRTGKVGSAHGMKALNNYVYAAGLLAASEALMLGKALDLNLDTLVDVLNASSGRNVATETKLKQHMLDGGDFKAGFGLHLMAKDLGIAHGLNTHAGFTPPQLTLCYELWQEACQQMPSIADNTEIYRFLETKLQLPQHA